MSNDQRRMTLDLTHLNQTRPPAVELDGQKITGITSNATGKKIWFTRNGGSWAGGFGSAKLLLSRAFLLSSARQKLRRPDSLHFIKQQFLTALTKRATPTCH